MIRILRIFGKASLGASCSKIAGSVQCIFSNMWRITNFPKAVRWS